MSASSSTACDRFSAATAILDFNLFPRIDGFPHPAVAPGRSDRDSLPAEDVVRQWYAFVRDAIRPAFSVDERRPASDTLGRREGSCSQRFALVEALARRSGVPTRVRGWIVPGRFWAQRFPNLRCALPRSVVLALPEFWCAGQWVGIDDACGPVPGSLVGNDAFTNECGGETLFEAIGSGAARPLPGRLLGVYATRDDLFDTVRTRFRAGVPAFAVEWVLRAVTAVHRRRYRDQMTRPATAAPPGGIPCT